MTRDAGSRVTVWPEDVVLHAAEDSAEEGGSVFRWGIPLQVGTTGSQGTRPTLGARVTKVERKSTKSRSCKLHRRSRDTVVGSWSGGCSWEQAELPTWSQDVTAVGDVSMGQGTAKEMGEREKEVENKQKFAMIKLDVGAL